MTDEPKTPESDKPGALDTSEAVNVTKDLEEANKAGYLGASFDDEDLTVEGVTSEHKGGAAPDAPTSVEDTTAANPEPSQSQSESQSQSAPTPPPSSVPPPKKDKGGK